MENNQKIITIMGSGSSGKTTTALKLATALAAHKKTVIILALDGDCPVIPYVMPVNIEQEVSLADLFSREELTEFEVDKACIPVPNHEFLQMIGYRSGDVGQRAMEEQVTSLFSLLQSKADYLLVDCASNLSDLPSKIAVELADIVLQLGTACPKGLAYYSVADKVFTADKTCHFLVNNFKKSEDVATISKAYGGVSYVFPYCEELWTQLLERNLFSPLTKPSSLVYEKEMEKLLGDLFRLFPEKQVIYKKRGPVGRFFRWIIHGEGKGEF